MSWNRKHLLDIESLSAAEITTILDTARAFKAGSRPSTIMGQLSKGFSEAQIDQLAGYFSTLKP